jgi:SM-20-related protein
MPHHIVPNWLGEDKADQLLSYAFTNEARFKQSHISKGGGQADISLRRSLVLADLGPFAQAIKAKALEWQAEFENALGMHPASTHEVEIEMVAHGDGAFYGPHIDTSTGPDSGGSVERRLSLIYYFFRRPQEFSGGRLRLLRLGGGPALLIEPAHDRLVGFPSFAPHEVEAVSCPNGGFRNSRFAINIWLYERRPGRSFRIPES